MDKDKFDIVIVGAGIVGATLACALASLQNGKALSIAIVEPGKPPEHYSDISFDPRVVALTRKSQLLFNDLGVWSAIEAGRPCAYHKMHVWDGEGTAAIDFSDVAVKQDNLGHIVENSLVLNSLLEKLSSFKNVELIRGEKVESIQKSEFESASRTDNNQSATNKNNALKQTSLQLTGNRVLSSNLVLAADGGNSAIRKMLAMPTREWSYGQQAIVTTVRTEHSHAFTAWQRFMTTGPLAFLPLLTESGDDHHSSIVWSLTDAQLPAVMAMKDDEFAEKLGAEFEFRLGRVESVAKRYAFPLIQRHAIDYVKPGIALVGDAAHTIHPLAGQGVNLGLEDVAVLVAEIDRAISRQLPLSDFSILKRYQRERKDENLKMMAVMEGFKRLFESVNPVVSTSRNIGMTSINRIPLLKNAIVKHALGL
ncbi:2-octaprenyl-3-methyl-6-methoxy-1,4-benzoquinol hydroxylase [Aurantivibrio infirmus]